MVVSAPCCKRVTAITLCPLKQYARSSQFSPKSSSCKFMLVLSGQKKDSSVRKGIFLWKAKTYSNSMCLRVPLGVQILFLEVSTDGKCPSNFPLSKQTVQHRHFQLHVLPQGQSQYLPHSTHIYHNNNAWLDSSLHDIHNLCFQSFISHIIPTCKTISCPVYKNEQILLLIKYFNLSHILPLKCLSFHILPPLFTLGPHPANPMLNPLHKKSNDFLQKQTCLSMQHTNS